MCHFASILLVLAALTQLSSAAIATHHFESWYWYNEDLSNILHENCSTEYANYLNKYDTLWYFESPRYQTKIKSGEQWVYANPLVNCLLEHMDDYSKANMAATGVLLGLLPTILAYAGSTVTETALLSVRRPLLAFFLAMGSSSVVPLRTFEHKDILIILARRERRGVNLNPSLYIQPLIVALEMALALASTVNVVLLSYELGMKTFCRAQVMWFTRDIQLAKLIWHFPM